MAQFESYQNGQTSLDPFIKVMVYDDRFNNKTSEVITLRAERNEWQRIMMSQQRFKVLANGFVELYGYVTINVDRDVTVGISLILFKIIIHSLGLVKVENVIYFQLNIN